MGFPLLSHVWVASFNSKKVQWKDRFFLGSHKAKAKTVFIILMSLKVAIGMSTFIL